MPVVKDRFAARVDHEAAARLRFEMERMEREEEELWKSVVRECTVLSMKRYLADTVIGRYRDQAQARLEEIETRKTQEHKERANQQRIELRAKGDAILPGRPWGKNRALFFGFVGAIIVVSSLLVWAWSEAQGRKAAEAEVARLRVDLSLEGTQRNSLEQALEHEKVAREAAEEYGRQAVRALEGELIQARTGRAERNSALEETRQTLASEQRRASAESEIANAKQRISTRVRIANRTDITLPFVIISQSGGRREFTLRPRRSSNYGERGERLVIEYDGSLAPGYQKRRYALNGVVNLDKAATKKQKQQAPLYVFEQGANQRIVLYKE
jgi:hypothetical protein